MAILKTNDNRLSTMDLNRLIPYIKEHDLYQEFFIWIPKTIWNSIKKPIKPLFLP